MSERPTLTVSVPCPTCGGRRSRTSSEVADLMGLEGNARPKEEYLIRCPDCTDGTIRQAVGCGSCKWWNHLEEGWGVCLRTEVDEETQQPLQTDSIAYVWGESIDGQCALMTHATHGCLSWEAKA